MTDCTEHDRQAQRVRRAQGQKGMTRVGTVMTDCTEHDRQAQRVRPAQGQKGMTGMGTA